MYLKRLKQSFSSYLRSCVSETGTECVSYVFCSVLSPSVALTSWWPHIQGDPNMCICLLFCGLVRCFSYRYLTIGHLCCKSRGVVFLQMGDCRLYNKREEEKERELSWSIRSLHSNPAVGIRFPEGISILGLGVCRLYSVLYCLWRWLWHFNDDPLTLQCSH